MVVTDLLEQGVPMERAPQATFIDACRTLLGTPLFLTAVDPRRGNAPFLRPTLRCRFYATNARSDAREAPRNRRLSEMSEPSNRQPQARWDHYDGTAPLVDQFQVGSADLAIFYFTLGQVAGPLSVDKTPEERQRVAILPVRTLSRFAMSLNDVRILHQLLGKLLADVDSPE